MKVKRIITDNELENVAGGVKRKTDGEQKGQPFGFKCPYCGGFIPASRVKLNREYCTCPDCGEPWIQNGGI